MARRNLLDYFGTKEVRIPLPLKYNSSTPFGKVGVQSPLTVIDGKDIRVHEVVLSIIMFHKEPPAVILDPTCGKENHQFRPWIEQGILDKLGYEYIPCDIKPYGEIVLDVLSSLPFRDESADIIVYDPPFTPNRRADERGVDYDIAKTRTPEEVKIYYSESVFKEFHRVLKTDGIVLVKGMDYYYPKNTDNLYLFIEQLEYKKYFKPIALYIYRFYYRGIPLLRYRCKHWKRPLIDHIYYLVLKKR